MKAKFYISLLLSLSFQWVTLKAQVPMQSVQLANQGYAILYTDSSLVKAYNAQGRVEYRFGGWGIGAESLDRAVHLSAQSGLKLLLTDAGQRKVLVLDRRLQRIAEFEFEILEPDAAFYVGIERIMVLGNELSEWLLVDSRSGEEMSIYPELPNQYNPISIRAYYLENEGFLLPPNSSDVEQKWLVFDENGRFKKWYKLPSDSKTIIQSDDFFYLQTNDAIIRMSQQAKLDTLKAPLSNTFGVLHSVNGNDWNYITVKGKKLKAESKR